MKLDKKAIIDIGSSAIRMSIYEIKADKLKLLDELWQTVKLGIDTFNTGKISRKLIDESIAVLKRYKKICNDLGVSEIFTVGTTAVRESSNADIFIDNIRTFTGLEVSILSPNEEIQLIFKTITENDPTIDVRSKNCIIEVSAGTINVSIFSDECIIYSRTLPLGSLKMIEIYHDSFSNEKSYPEFLKSTLDHEVRYLKKEMPKVRLTKIFGICSELEEIAHIVKGDSEILKVTIEDLKKYSDLSQNKTSEELTNELNIPHDITDTFYTTCATYYKLMSEFKVGEIYLPDISLRDAIIKNKTASLSDTLYFENMFRQIKIHAIKIGKKLNFDEKHALRVAKLALEIFNGTERLHQMGNEERSYLLVASILHDIGLSISSRSHHKHSLYVIQSQDFFFFDNHQKNIIANIARYHRRSEPRSSHLEYEIMPQKDKMTITKLAAILRIADSLDASHLQLIQNLTCVLKDDKLILKVMCKSRIFNEEYSFKSKKVMFENFFGRKVVLNIQENKEI